MKIDQNVTYLKNMPGTAPSVTAKSSASGPASAARAVASQGQLPSTNGDFDASRVAQIRESIAAGRYQVDTAKIADGLLASVRDLLSNRSS
ncbi:MAG: flagellar biosynthesis anti-sigma factor FlgM [Polaromonas sp. 39-63-203]|jgi:negative regulator of flagellin synthesis FlgM|uniref:flagellar biosynthesis anti-sigma factor FlgM n=1 Tax=Polaromonas sp. TaxID=1869339 RepID=UPI000BD722F4|nr:flagellar biosynthesis anti-sigma factor FlgM [Polaromonas sp.]OYY53581.1 MAG: flagellar biosynthesis anti-sigma factor FlgM [Polaromonas sp. 35-63-240]OYZ03242.1 MAG: flagellar biosynthesis anti-sigma factor FlgM [Polaromonas sp. 28-63-22]OYZ85012.1 MAG: flagellar biosynthesis anti-sigma factor FlgM [Polaromonas sp. 24-62-144]OZB02359.1 MAG: flagellar biosynthesis anti-sigma factor FlgM [Polaromonas sp. 39-63-203]HQS32637.1 flagellar biosynthesis anti-sigma factor FlgM [Polaromonas sp.]